MLNLLDNTQFIAINKTAVSKVYITWRVTMFLCDLTKMFLVYRNYSVPLYLLYIKLLYFQLAKRRFTPKVKTVHLTQTHLSSLTLSISPLFPPHFRARTAMSRSETMHMHRPLKIFEESLTGAVTQYLFVSPGLLLRPHVEVGAFLIWTGLSGGFISVSGLMMLKMHNAPRH